MLVIRNQTLPTRCEICHQRDCFNPVANRCSRCQKYPQTRISPEQNRVPSRTSRHWLTVLASPQNPIEGLLAGICWAPVAALGIGVLFLLQVRPRDGSISDVLGLFGGLTVFFFILFTPVTVLYGTMMWLERIWERWREKALHQYRKKPRSVSTPDFLCSPTALWGPASGGPYRTVNPFQGLVGGLGIGLLLGMGLTIIGLVGDGWHGQLASARSYLDWFALFVWIFCSLCGAFGFALGMVVWLAELSGRGLLHLQRRFHTGKSQLANPK